MRARLVVSCVIAFGGIAVGGPAGGGPGGGGLGAGAIGAAVTPALVAQESQRSFRAGTDLVSVYATVVEQDSGRLVTDLELLDFVVRDEGQIRPVALFSNDPQPFTVVIMLDRSGSMAEHFGVVREAAAEFVRQMRPDDRARIGSFSEEIVFTPGAFTSDQETLLRILDDGLQDMGPSPVWTAVDRSMTVVRPEPDRRVILVFSDGHNDERYGQVHTSLRDLLRRIEANGIMVYTIGFESEETQASFASTPSWPPRQPRGRGGFPLPLPRSGIRFGSKTIPPDPGLRELAERSGGGYFEWSPNEDLRATFARVAEELHHQYWLGFHPYELDGRQHDIDVRVRRPGLEVRARQSYVAR